MDEGTVLCEGLYVVLSLMSGYYAQGTSLRVLQSHTRKDWGNMPWCLPSSTHLQGGMLQGSAARAVHYCSYLERQVERNTCIAHQVSYRASLIPSSVSNLDCFHCSMKYIQIHTLFYAINCLKCKMVILCTAELCGTVSPVASPILGSSVEFCKGYSFQPLAPVVAPKPTWLSKCHTGDGFLCLICLWA